MQTSYTSAEHAITIGSKSHITARIGSSRGKWCQNYITGVPQSIVTKDGPAGHDPANRGLPRPPNFEPYEARLDLPSLNYAPRGALDHLLP